MMMMMMMMSSEHPKVHHQDKSYRILKGQGLHIFK